MQHCAHCEVDLREHTDHCPLCGNPVPLSSGAAGQHGAPGEGDAPDDRTFPAIPPSEERHIAIRIMLFLSVAVIVSSFTVRMIWPTTVNWPVFVVFGLCSMWLTLGILLRKRHNIPKTILWQVTLLSLLVVFWDWQTGWKGWSLDYAVPSLLIAALLALYVTAKVFKLGVRDYITYVFLAAWFGVVPILFLVFDWVKVFYPSLVCVAASVVFLAAIFIFQGGSIRSELHKRMHI